MAGEPTQKAGTTRIDKRGLPPGTAVLVGKRRTERIRVSVMAYNADTLDCAEGEDLDQVNWEPREDCVTWLNVDGLHRVDVIERLGERFGLHPLMLEDIVHTEQRPKIEDYDSRLYVVLKMFQPPGPDGRVDPEQVSLVLGDGFVLSFQERAGDVFDPVRERIRGAKGRIRTMGADYLLYSLMDAVVDGYFAVCEAFGEGMEDLEDACLNEPGPETSSRIHRSKRMQLELRKSIWPLREVLAGMSRLESTLITKSTELYLRDVYDHTIQVVDTIEGYRDVLSGLLDIHLSSISNRMNEVMKVLTVIATIFIPITFIAGIYGMNFQVMPELQWRYAYPATLLTMWVICAVMVYYFRRKDWL